MTITASAPSNRKELDVVEGGPASVVRRRTRTSTVLTSFTAAFVLGLAAAFGSSVILIFALTLAVPLALLWLSSDVIRSDEGR